MVRLRENALKNHLKLGFFSPDGSHGFSGINKSLSQHLNSNHCQCDVIPPPPAWQTSLVRRIFYGVVRRITGKSFLWDKEISRCRKYSNAIDQAAATGKYDAILITGSENCAFCQTRLPIYCYGDSIFGTRIDFYSDQNLSRLNARSVRNGCELQQIALKRLRRLYLSSQWAVDRAKAWRNYEGIEKVKVVGIGANLVPDPDQPAPKKLLGEKIFLWIGADWHRKGGDLAVEIVKQLRAMKINARLLMVGAGSRPFENEWLKHHGKVYPNDFAARQLLMGLYRQSHVLLLPTKADITPIAIAEAYAFGCVPAVSPVGAVAEMLENDKNGWLLDGYSAVDWAKLLFAKTTRAEELQSMAEVNRSLYEAKWNWKHVCEVMVEDIRNDLQ